MQILKGLNQHDYRSGIRDQKIGDRDRRQSRVIKDHSTLIKDKG
jgi:hypothetical protein